MFCVINGNRNELNITSVVNTGSVVNAITNVSSDVSLAISSNFEINFSLVQSSVFYGILSESVINKNNVKINENCLRDMERTLSGINNKNLWAIKGK